MSNIFIDIETIPEQPEEAVKARIAETIKAPATMKKAETIAEWHNGAVFPAVVGITREYVHFFSLFSCVPRSRGDNPALDLLPPSAAVCSPQSWG